MAKFVKILFPGLTHKGKVYSLGEIEKDPTAFLIEAAGKKTKQFHRDSHKSIRLCRFVTVDDEGYVDDEEEEVVVRTPVVQDHEAGGLEDELSGMSKLELCTIASSLGMKKKFVKEIKDEAIIKKIITFLRTI